MSASPNLNPNVAASLAKWHAMVESKDLGGIASIIHSDATFRSPMAFKPYHSAQAVSVVLEFSARVGDKNLKGIDLIQFDAGGLITDFEVMIRPFNGLQALGAEMGARLGHLLPNYKVGA